jgi:hypothetical protein
MKLIELDRHSLELEQLDLPTMKQVELDRHTMKQNNSVDNRWN